MSSIWTTLNPLHEEAFAADAERLRASLNAKIAKLLTARDEFDADLAALRAIPPEKFDAKALDRANDMKAKRLSLLRQESALRAELADAFFPLRYQERERMRAEASDALEKAKADVRQRLVGIGYVEGIIPGGEIECIVPDLVFRHPAVFAARVELQTAEARLVSLDEPQANNEALQRVNAKIESIVAAAVGGIAA